MFYSKTINSLTNALKVKSELQKTIKSLNAGIRKESKEIGFLRRKGLRTDEIEAQRSQLEHLKSELASKQKTLKDTDQHVDQMRRRLDKLEPPIENPHPRLSDRYPILMFPVR